MRGSAKDYRLLLPSAILLICALTGLAWMIDFDEGGPIEVIALLALLTGGAGLYVHLRGREEDHVQRVVEDVARANGRILAIERVKFVRYNPSGAERPELWLRDGVDRFVDTVVRANVSPADFVRIERNRDSLRGMLDRIAREVRPAPVPLDEPAPDHRGTGRP